MLLNMTDLNSPERIELRDRIGMMNFRDPQLSHKVLQRLTWIMADPSIISTAIDDVENSPR